MQKFASEKLKKKVSFSLVIEYRVVINNSFARRESNRVRKIQISYLMISRIGEIYMQGMK